MELAVLMRVLVVNAGSSSLKLSVLDPDDTVVARASVPVSRGRWERDALAERLADFPRPQAVGHRVVHGGREFLAPVRLDARVLRRLGELSDLAPLHQPTSLAGIDAVTRELPDVPAAACFDTAFHATLPPEASTYAIPAQWRTAHGLRRYGFHGLSHAYASRRAAELTGASRILVAHLGAGASLAAVRDGRCVDTTMGFTPLEGLVMATRSGSIDPGMLLWLADHAKIATGELADALEHRSGLAALAGTSDMRQILGRDDPPAALALKVYLHRLRAEIAAMTAALGGLDTLVFTGGVGEHAHQVRGRAADGLGFLGIAVDPGANRRAGGDADITAADARVRTLVITAREDIEIAAGTRRALRD